MSPARGHALIAYDLLGGIAEKRKISRTRRINRFREILQEKASAARDCDSDRSQQAAGSASLYPQSPSGGAGTDPAGTIRCSDPFEKFFLIGKSAT